MNKFFNSKFFAGVFKPVLTFLIIGILTGTGIYGKQIFLQESVNQELKESIKILSKKDVEILQIVNEKNTNTNSRIDKTQDSLISTLVKMDKTLNEIKDEQFRQRATQRLLLKHSNNVKEIKETLNAIFGDDTTENTNN